MRASFRLGRIGGIEIGVHYTWVFAFILITWTLAEGFFPQLYPDWNTLTYWITGAISALLLFVSVLVHELAHSFVARAKGLPVQGITLFIFGGVSNLAGEAKRAGDEFAIAVVGPATSLVLAGLFWGIYQVNETADSPLIATIRYLAIINGILALFNILPGFPLDGGRVLRSIIWGATGSLRRATDIAAGVGQVFGWVLIGWGVFIMLTQGSFLSGLWIAFVGWFLSSAADSARREVATQEMFRGVTVREVMDAEPETVKPSTSVDEMVRESFLRRGKRAAPVCDGDRLVGIVTLTDIREVPQERWPTTPVSEVMTREPLYSVAPTDDLASALNKLGENNLNQVLVTEDGKLVGMLSRADIIRFLRGIEELGLSSPAQINRTRTARPI